MGIWASCSGKSQVEPHRDTDMHSHTHTHTHTHTISFNDGVLQHMLNFMVL
jgi:hypothetical protein